MPSCFIAMPISTSKEHAQLYGDDLHFEHILVHLMVPAVERAGYEAIKPLATGADVIQAEIIRQLETADLVLCDMSTLNPNVFFELGIRTAVDLPVCIVKDIQTDRIPFDTSIMNVHTYDASLVPWVIEHEIGRLAEHIVASAERSAKRNTLWRYFGLTTRAAFREGESSLEEKMDLILLQLAGLEGQSRWMPSQVTLPVSIQRIVPLSPEVGHGGASDDSEAVLTVASETVDNATWRKFLDKVKLDIPNSGDLDLRLRDGKVSFNAGALLRLSVQDRYRLKQAAKQYRVQLPPEFE